MFEETSLSETESYHIFNYDGFPIHVKQYSKGKTDIPLVFIGGAFQNISRVEKISSTLAQHTWVITIDTPGNGDTGVLPSNMSFDFICQSINFALKQLDVDVINLMGVSYSSITAMRYVQNFIGVENLILASAMSDIPERLQHAFSHLVFHLEWNKNQEFADEFTDLMTNSELREKNRLARLAGDKLHNALLTASQGIKEQFKHNTIRILRDGTTDLTNMPDVNTTVLVGKYDHFIPVDANERVANAFKRSNFVVVDNADHMIHVEKFKDFINIILDGIGCNNGGNDGDEKAA